MSSQWNVVVDRETCIGSGLCRSAAPAVFTPDSDGKTVASSPIMPDDTVLDSAEMCPVEAITVTDHTSGEQLAPDE